MAAWKHLQDSGFATNGVGAEAPQASYPRRNQEHKENSADTFRDVHAAYKLEVRWKLFRDDTFAGDAATILEA